MDNLQQAMVDAEWERRAAEQHPYRVLAPAAPGAVCYWMALALVADGAGRDDLVQPALDAAGEAASNDDRSRAVLRAVKNVLARARTAGSSAEDAALKAEKLVDQFLGGV